jgi:Fe-S-cluster-containing dehydrogenase component
MKTASQQNTSADVATEGEDGGGKPGRNYWRSMRDARPFEAPDPQKYEFTEGASEWLDAVSRRRFLTLMGASAALAGLAGCTRQPIEKIVPYVRQPEDVVPGRPLFFATAMTLGGYASGLLVESHEGHPTKIEGNPEHPLSLGSSSVFQQASLLDLYDPDRSQAVLNNGEISDWAAFLSALRDALEPQRAQRGAGLRILTETVTSLTLHAQIRQILAQYPEARWHQFEPVNRDNVHEGARVSFGAVVEPQYHFDKARVVLALDSDFMFTHPAGLLHTREFIDGRRASSGQSQMNRLYAVESTPTITGSNADHRLALPPAEIAGLTYAIAAQLGVVPAEPENAKAVGHQEWISAIVADFRENHGAGIVIAGENQPAFMHTLAHALNESLGNVGKTVHYTASAEAEPVNQLESLRALNDDLKNGAVAVLLILGGNPAFSAPADFDFAQNLAKAAFRAHLNAEVNETSALCQWHIPQNHFLESWSDARACDGTVSVVQPLIIPLYAGKSSHEVLDAFSLEAARTDYDIVREYWQKQNHWDDFEKGWRRALHDGSVAGTALPALNPKLLSVNPPASMPGSAAELQIVFRPDPAIWDGRFANNGWLQELPKPLIKIVWDNAALISPALAREQSLENGDLVELSAAGRTLRLPVWITPGQAEHVIAIYLGGGRNQVGRVGKGAGFDAYKLRTSQGMWAIHGATLRKLGETYPLVTTQEHHGIDSPERQIYREATLADFIADPSVVKQSVEAPDRESETLFNPAEHPYNGYRWGMSVDLTACIGCNACTLACQAENNIPVVGKEQVAKGREMHWIRVDTYFSGSADDPAVSHQPVPCMQCENAPCELVCPVGATLHDHEGLNLQVYNRCVGTRYCSNNCPYKVRRFNFLQYADYHTPSLKPMRNPNVTVRWRGVMEKCTYCIQRISAARISTEEQGRNIKDGEVLTACQQACPAQAIVFGDLNDPNSRVSRLKRHPLDYAMLGELNTQPRTTYLARLRNPNKALPATGSADAVKSNHA